MPPPFPAVPIVAGTRKGFTVKASRYIFVSLFLSLLALPLAAQIKDTYVIPAAGNTPGANSTTWATRLSIFNPQTYKLRISMTVIPTLGGQGIEKLVDIPANAMAYYGNVFHDVYGIGGTGALLIATFPEDNPGVPNNVIDRAFLVESDTYNNASSGTFGQTIPGVFTGLQDFATDGISAIAHGVINNVGGWRTNIGAVNLGRSSVTMRVSVYDFDGNTILNKAPFTIPPQAHLQDRLPVTVDRGSVEFFLDDPSKDAVIFPYASVIDPGSGDPTYHSPLLLASPSVLANANASKKTALLTSPLGRQIDTAYARTVRDHAARTGEVGVRTSE
jgi:hypothetical protein